MVEIADIKGHDATHAFQPHYGIGLAICCYRRHAFGFRPLLIAALVQLSGSVVTGIEIGREVLGGNLFQIVAAVVNLL